MKLALLALLSALVLLAPTARARDKNADGARVLLRGKAPISALAYAPDGKTLASADESGRLTLIDIGTGKITQDFRYKSPVSALAYAPDGKLLAIGVGSEVRLLDPKSDMKTAAPVRVLKANREISDTLNFSADGRILLATGGDYERALLGVDIWNVASGQRLRHYESAKTEDYIAALSPDGANFVAPGPQGECRLFSVATGKKIRDFSDKFPRNEVPYLNHVKFSPDGKWLAGTGFYFEANGHLTVWETASGRLKWSRDFVDASGTIAWSPDSSSVAAGTDYDTTYDDPQHLHKPTGAALFHSSGPWRNSVQRVPGEINALAWSPDGTTLATGDGAGTVRLWIVGA